MAEPLQDERRWTIWHCPNHGWVDRTAECRVCEGGLDSIEVVPGSSLDQALAERDRALEDIEVLEVANERKIDVEGELARYREVAEELAEALEWAVRWIDFCHEIPLKEDELADFRCWEQVREALAHYEALRDG